MEKSRKNLIELNKNQLISETDSFSLERYALFNNYFYEGVRTVLDYGCNVGRGGVKLKSLNPNLQLFGADIISERLNKIPPNIYSTIIDLNISKISNIISDIDAIVSGEVVEHIPIRSLMDILQEFYDILNPNGILLLTTPNPNSFLVRLGRDSVLKDPSHVNIMDCQFLKTLVQKIGFSEIEILGSGKATKYFGQNFPLFGVYGSYMLVAKKRINA